MLSCAELRQADKNAAMKKSKWISELLLMLACDGPEQIPSRIFTPVGSKQSWECWNKVDAAIVFHLCCVFGCEVVWLILDCILTNDWNIDEMYEGRNEKGGIQTSSDVSIIFMLSRSQRIDAPAIATEPWVEYRDE